MTGWYDYPSFSFFLFTFSFPFSTIEDRRSSTWMSQWKRNTRLLCRAIVCEIEFLILGTIAVTTDNEIELEYTRNGFLGDCIVILPRLYCFPKTVLDSPMHQESITNALLLHQSFSCFTCGPSLSLVCPVLRSKKAERWSRPWVSDDHPHLFRNAELHAGLRFGQGYCFHCQRYNPSVGPRKMRAIISWYMRVPSSVWRLRMILAWTSEAE